MKRTINFDQRILHGLSSLVSKDELKDALMHVYLEMIYDKENDTFYPQWTASDGYVLATIKDETPQNDETETWLHAQMSEMKEDIPFTLQLKPETKKSIFDKRVIGNVLVINTETHMYTFIGKKELQIRQYDKNPDNYPNYRSVIPDKNKSEAVLAFGIDAELLLRFKELSHAYDLKTTPIILMPTGKDEVIRVGISALNAYNIEYEAFIMPIRID